MKTIRISTISVVFAYAMSLCISCEKQTETIDSEKITVNPASLDFAKGKDSYSVDIACADAWIVEVPEQWISVSPQSGNGNGTVTISVEENESSAARNSYVKISSSSDFAVVGIHQSSTNNAENQIEHSTQAYGNVTTENGAIKAAFSVSPTKKVYFSHGNLQYRASTDTWRFAEEQYNTICDDNFNRTSSFDGWIDLFSYGTSGYNNLPPCFELTVDNFNLVAWEKNNMEENPNYDWGVYNAISNGGNANGLWRTPTIEEWKYLIKGRENASNRYGVACVDGKNGLVILPDEWLTPAGLTFNPGCEEQPLEENYQIHNNYTAEEWKQMESFGAVFLHAASAGDYGLLYNARGHYWSSSTFIVYDYEYAQCFYFHSATIGFYVEDRPALCSVRLVQDVKE